MGLAFTVNHYNGVVAASEDFPDNPAEFLQALQSSLISWQTAGHPVVWLHLSLKQSDLIAPALTLGFNNHHANSQEFVLTKRLIKDALIPDYASHTVGVGGIVINQQQQVLTIREKAHVEKYPNNWKFPGGMLDINEHIQAGVMREIEEETAIKTEFVRLLGFRHYHESQFGTSNIYAVCLLRPLTHNIVKQESEIADAKWISVSEYLANEKIGELNKKMLTAALNGDGLNSVSIANYAQSGQAYEVFI
ncbi:NUDIX domain-containing protein [Aliikangiella sp. IMCC44653]